MTTLEKEYLENIIESEGFDYALIHYTNFEYVKDLKFHALREAFCNSRDELTKYLETEGIELFDE